MQLWRIGILISAAVSLASCYEGPEYTPEQRSCIAQRYYNYDPTKFSQCVDVCKACMRGNTTTCTTSCTLKSAD